MGAEEKMSYTPTQPYQQVAQGDRRCVSCGRPIDWNALFCPHCGHNYSQTLEGQISQFAKQFRGSWAILIILLILCWPAGLIYFFYKWN